jgi:hypothetical protein
MQTSTKRSGAIRMQDKIITYAYTTNKYLKTVWSSSKYLVKTSRNKNCIHEKCKSWLHSRYYCYHSVHIFFHPYTVCKGARGSVIGWGTISRKVAGSISETIGFFKWFNPSSCTMALGSTKPLTEMSTSNVPGGKALPARKACNLNAICEPGV